MVSLRLEIMGILTQRVGDGTYLAKDSSATSIWCNARTPAIGFYLQFGFERTGKLFSKNGFDYEIMEKIIRL